MAGFWNSLGNWVDETATSYNLPELGISEAIAGGDTTNTGVGGMTPYQGTAYGPVMPTQDPNAVQTQDPYTTQNISTGGGTAPAPAYVPNMVTFKGIQYDLNNEADRNAFIQTQSAAVDKQLSDALKAGQLGYAAKLLDYKHSWEAQGQELAGGYSQGMTGRQQAFQGRGTRAYQSAMGTSGQNALNQLGNAQNERNYQKGQFDTGMEGAYNEWIQGAQGQAQTQKDTLATDVTNIGGFDSTGINNKQVDVSQYTPFTNFQQFANAPTSSGGGKSMAPAPQMTLSQYLQQNTASQQDPNYLSQYLMGK